MFTGKLSRTKSGKVGTEKHRSILFSRTPWGRIQLNYFVRCKPKCSQYAVISAICHLKQTTAGLAGCVILLAHIGTSQTPPALHAVPANAVLPLESAYSLLSSADKTGVMATINHSASVLRSADFSCDSSYIRTTFKAA